MLQTSAGRYCARFLRHAALICAGYAALLSPPALGDTSRQDLIVATNFPPIMIQDSPDRPGYAIEILQIAAERANREIIIAFYPLPRALMIMQEEDNVLFPSLLRTHDREDQFRWLAQINTQFFQFVSRDAPIDTLGDARSLHTIAVPGGGVADDFLTREGFENIFRVSNSKTALLMLAHERVGAWLTSELIAEQYVQENDTGVPLVIGQPVHELSAFIAAGPNMPEDVATAYRAAFETMRADGTVARIAEKYDVTLD